MNPAPSLYLGYNFSKKWLGKINRKVRGLIEGAG